MNLIERIENILDMDFKDLNIRNTEDLVYVLVAEIKILKSKNKKLVETPIKIEINTPCVFNNNDNFQEMTNYYGYFAGINEKGEPLMFRNGTTQWTCLKNYYGKTDPFKYCMPIELMDILSMEKNQKIRKYRWISTKTAKPTNIRPVLATTGQDTFIAAYVRQYEIEEQQNDDEFAEFNEVDQSYYLIEGWYEVLTFWQEYTHLYIDQPVTHWMPLFTRPAD